MDGTDPATPLAPGSDQPPSLFFHLPISGLLSLMAMMGHFFHHLVDGSARAASVFLKMQDKQKPSPRRVWKNPGRSGSCRSHGEDPEPGRFGSDGLPSARQAPTLETSWKARREAHQDGDHLTNLHRLAGVPRPDWVGTAWKGSPRASARSL